MINDLTPNKDGKILVNTEDDVIRGSLVTHSEQITFPPPPPKVQAIAKPQVKAAVPSKEELRAQEVEALRSAGKRQTIMLIFGALFMGIIGIFAPPSFMQHFIVFALSCFVGFQVIWNVSHSLHTPLMAVTNAISGIIIIGALLQVGDPNFIVEIFTVSILIATPL